MTIQIRGIPIQAPLRQRIAERVTSVLKKLPVEPTAVQATFFDENGPRGGRAMRCALTVRLPYRPHIRVEHVAETPRLAFDGCFAVFDRELAQYRERDRESKRYPKKYYSAKRLLTEGLESAPPPSRRRSRGGG